jgi:hypothetical protein
LKQRDEVVVRSFVQKLGLGFQRAVDFENAAAHRREYVGYRFDGFDHREALARLDIGADGGEFHKHDVAQRFLRVRRDANAGVFALENNPFMVLGVFAIRRCHMRFLLLLWMNCSVYWFSRT